MTCCTIVAIGALVLTMPIVASTTSGQWSRAVVTWDPENFPPNRADWTDPETTWELRRVGTVAEIPAIIRAQLEQLDCRIPRWLPRDRRPHVETSVVRGELERAGQIDLAVLCVHSDNTSATYVFWAGDPVRRTVMPQSGSSIQIMRAAEVARRADIVRGDQHRPRDPDMPARVAHDAIEIGCCECCSTIFYRHRGTWFTLPGAD